jgi:hypothetical protein
MTAMNEFWLKVINIHQTRGFWAAVDYVKQMGWPQDDAITQVQGALRIKNDRPINDTAGASQRQAAANVFDFGQPNGQPAPGQEPSHATGQSQSPGR